MLSRVFTFQLKILCRKLLLQNHLRLSNVVVSAGASLLLGVAMPAPAAQAQADKMPATATAALPGAGKVAAPSASTPLWTDLTVAQQTALQPLETHWNALGESNKRRWLALSRNYSRLTPDDQRTLHGRMTEWAALSGRERVQARLNFAEVKQLAPSERKAKWEAYQALSEADKRKLADKAPVRPKSAAVPVRPVPAKSLVQVPPPPLKGEHGPRIELAPRAESAHRASLPALPKVTSDVAVSPSGVSTLSESVAAPLLAPSPAAPTVRTPEQMPSAP